VQERDLPAVAHEDVLIFVDAALDSCPAYFIALEAHTVVADFGGEAVDGESYEGALGD